MVSSPQKGWGNVFLTVSVTITLYLASNVVVQKERVIQKKNLTVPPFVHHYFTEEMQNELREKF